MIAAVTGNLWRAAAMMLAGVCLALAVMIFGLPVLGGGLKADLANMTRLRLAEAASHRKTKESYTAAQADAARAEVFRLARVKAEQERINANAQADYTRRLADARARYERLRSQAGTVAGSSASGEPVPALPSPAFGPDAAAGADGLAVSELNLTERWEATQQALQLDALISWIEQQADVPVNEE